MVKLDIITGFLGSGKTTLINKLLAEAYIGDKPVLIENEFGDVSIDDMLIADPDVQVRVLASGCVCCTLKGDFISGIIEIVNQYSPARIIVEPTGLADPADIRSACEEACGSVPARINSFITLANAENLLPLLTVGGELFRKQIADANLLLLNRANRVSPEELSGAIAAIRELNSNCLVLEEGADPLDGLSLLTFAEEAAGPGPMQYDNGQRRQSSSEHHHNHFEETASLAFYPEKSFSNKDIETLSALFSEGSAGQVLRAKGFLRKDDGRFVQIQYVYGQIESYETTYSGAAKFVIIGSQLNEHLLSDLLQ